MKPTKLRAFQIFDETAQNWIDNPANPEPEKNKLRRQERNKRKISRKSFDLKRIKRERKASRLARKENRA